MERSGVKTAGNRIPYGLHWLDEEDIAQVSRAMRSEWITQGPLVEEFERRVAATCGARFGVAFSSGTAALHAACFAAGLGPQDEAVTTPLTFVATANAVVYQGAKPVFADVDPGSLNIDPEEISRRLSPRTKAILPVHFAGLPADLESIARIARQRGLWVIEDACHALGAQWKDSQDRWQRVGNCSHSDMAVFSFHPVKHITTGEGGMVLTNREDLTDRLRAFRHHGLGKPEEDETALSEPWRQEMVELGYNYRITDFQCALGLRQLEKLDQFLVRRQAIAESYTRSWQGLGLVPQQFNRDRFRHAWHLYVVQLPSHKRPLNRRAAFERMRARGILAHVHYLPVHLHPFYRRRFSYQPGNYPVAERYYERALTLPLFPKMSDSQVGEVIEGVHLMLEQLTRPLEPVVKGQPWGGA